MCLIKYIAKVVSGLVESIFSGMPTVGSKKSSFVCDIDQSVSWVVSYPRKLWTPGREVHDWVAVFSGVDGNLL